MPLLGLRRIAVSGAVVAGVVSLGAWNGTWRDVAPNACKFVSVAEVSALTGAQVGGGEISMVDNAASLTASCMYTTSGRPSVIVMVGDYPTAAAAHQELVTQMHGSTDNVAEPGLGDGAFGSTVNAVSITAVRGARMATIAIIGGAAALHDPLHALMVKALAR